MNSFDRAAAATDDLVVRQQHPSPWAFITYQQVGAELTELTHASEAALLVAALRFDEQGQEDETAAGRRYYRAMADAVRCVLAAKAETA